jgi:hypothetical protein
MGNPRGHVACGIRFLQTPGSAPPLSAQGHSGHYEPIIPARLEPNKRAQTLKLGLCLLSLGPTDNDFSRLGTDAMRLFHIHPLLETLRLG